MEKHFVPAAIKLYVNYENEPAMGGNCSLPIVGFMVSEEDPGIVEVEPYDMDKSGCIGLAGGAAKVTYTTEPLFETI